MQTRGNRQVVKVYIDYNNDGDFVDAGENVFSNTAASGGTISHTGSFTIPTTATTCTWSVSYTHLDVYKRQDLCWPKERLLVLQLMVSCV